MTSFFSFFLCQKNLVLPEGLLAGMHGFFLLKKSALLWEIFIASSLEKVLYTRWSKWQEKCEKKTPFSILIQLLFKQCIFSALHVYKTFLLNCSSRMLICLYLHVNLYCHILYGKSEIKNMKMRRGPISGLPFYWLQLQRGFLLVAFLYSFSVFWVILSSRVSAYIFQA